MIEKQIENKLTMAVKKNGGIALKLVCLILLPDGHIGFAELKAPGKKPRPLQLSRHRLLRELGYRVYVIDDPKQIGGMIDELQST